MKILVLGDLNMNFLQSDSALFSHLNRTMLLPLQLTHLITQATRFSKGGQAGLDVVLSNSDKLHSGSVRDCDVSDHCLVTATLDCDSHLVKNTPPMYFRRDFRQFDRNTFQLLLQNTDLSQFDSYDVNEMWSR